MQTMALMGSHRVGKTTLAKAYAEKHDLDFVSCSVSPAYKALGIPMGTPTEFSVRMTIQDTALTMYTKALNEQVATGRNFIADRCFLDLVGYTLADFPNNASAEESVWLSEYVDKCVTLNQQYYHSVVLIRPGIPIKEDMTSWSAESGVIDKVDACMLWAADLTEDAVFKIPKMVIDLDQRIDILEVISESWI